MAGIRLHYDYSVKWWATLSRPHRSVESIKELKTPGELYSIIKDLDGDWDPAFFSFLYVSACRVSEALLLSKSQVRPDFEPGMAAVVNLVCVKRRKGRRRIPLRPVVYLPKEGELAPFTKLFLDYVVALPEGQEKVFPFSRQAAWNHIKKQADLWNHYFRSMGENWWVRRLGNNPIEAGKYLNVDPRSLEPYYVVDLEEVRRKVLGV